GWKSRDTLGKALRELLERGWIILARQGGRHQASLYAVTFFSIDDCPGKLLELSATVSPPGDWKKHEPVSGLFETKSVTRPAGALPANGHADRVRKSAQVAELTRQACQSVPFF